MDQPSYRLHIKLRRAFAFICIVISLHGICYMRFLQAKRDARLVFAVKSHNIALMEAALGEGADPNVRMHIETMPTFLEFICHDWSRFASAEFRQNASQSESALLWTLKVQSERDPPSIQKLQQGGPCALLLIEHGADVNINSKGTPALFYAVGDELTDVVAAMINHGANLHCTDGEDNTALMYAAYDDNIKALQILLDHGASVNAQNRQGKTALMEASQHQQLHALTLLLQAGADVRVQDQQGNTALKIARNLNAPEAVIISLKNTGVKD